jgi:stress response protein YsnF
MRQRIEAASSFSPASTFGNAIELLKIIHNIAFDFESQQYFPHALYEAHKRFYNFQQGKHTSLQTYLESFQNNLQVIRQIQQGKHTSLQTYLESFQNNLQVI